MRPWLRVVVWSVMLFGAWLVSALVSKVDNPNAIQVGPTVTAAVFAIVIAAAGVYLRLVIQRRRGSTS